jgi:hypothetical protein
MDDHKTKLSREAQARIDFVRSVIPKNTKHNHRQAVITTLGILIVVIILWIAFFGGSSKTSVTVKNKPNVPKAVSLTTTPTTTYSSQFFAMTMTYPRNWILKDSKHGLITITSPLTNLTSDTYKLVKGQVILTFAQQGSIPSGFNGGTDLAVLNSALVAYTNPTQFQSSQTYISFVQYPTTNVIGGLNGVYVTGNYGYQKDGVIPASEIQTINPLITATFRQCQNTACKAFEPLTITSGSWSSSPIGSIVTAIISSLVFTN